MSKVSTNYCARFWQKLDSATIQCHLCPRTCRLTEGQRGFCFVRQNIGGHLILTTYGRSSGFCIDPIEKKPLYHFYPGTAVLSFGTAGCNLGCKFCQNWDISRSREFDRLSEEATPEAIARAAEAAGCTSVAFTYNDPVIFAEYAIDVAKACHKQGIKTIAVTAGYIAKEARGEFFQYMDAANVDLKAFTEKFYKTLTLGSLQDVLDTLVFLKTQTNVWLEITNLLIPSKNDSAEEIDAMTQWIAKNLGKDVPLHFSAFHPDYRMTDLPPTSLETLAQARQIALKNGLTFVYTGNVYDPEGSLSTCQTCGELLIEREYYTLRRYHLKDRNHCANCQAIFAGEFSDTHGDWGARRLPINIKDFQ